MSILCATTPREHLLEQRSTICRSDGDGRSFACGLFEALFDRNCGDLLGEEGREEDREVRVKGFWFDVRFVI